MKKITLKLNKDELKKKLDIKNGETPSDSKLTSLIKPLIPEPIPGETPSDIKLINLIKPLIPEPIPGKPGSPDTVEQIIKKIQSYKKPWLDMAAILGDFNERVSRHMSVGGTGAMSLMSDVAIIEPEDGDTLIYNAESQKWENVPSSNFGGVWGDINGNIEDQTDLQDALDLKLDADDFTDSKVSVQSDDDGGYLKDKVIAGNNVTATVTGTPGARTLTISAADNSFINAIIFG